MRQNIARFLTVGLILGAILSSAIPSLADPETNKINTMEITIQSISGSDTYGVTIVLVGASSKYHRERQVRC